jgi:hypothetical protein
LGGNPGIIMNEQTQIELRAKQQELPSLRQIPKKKHWIKTERTEYLVNRLSKFQDDELTTISLMVELGDRAKRNIFLEELLRKIRLPSPYDVFEYRRGHGRRKGYWARRAYTRDFPTLAQLEARIQVAELSYLLFGTKGNVERDNGTTIARINHIVGEELRGKKIVSDEEKEERKNLSRVVEMSGVLIQLIP